MFERTAELYDLFYAWKDYRAEAGRLRDIIRARSPGATTVLDVACGTGAHLAHLREWFEAEGIDLDPGLLNVAASRLPNVPLHRGDMRDFQLGRSFDAVTCLFSSIGYVQTLDGLGQAIETMSRHLAADGVLVVEPWFSPSTFDPTHVARPIVVDRPDLQAVRMNGSRVEDGRSFLDFHYLIARPGSFEHLTETHVLGLFTDEDYRSAFAAAGLTAEHDPEGLIGRGLWIGQRASA